jgi:protein gp37
VNPTNIEWCSHTWNPITGCKRGCYYCYAKDLHEKRRKAFLEGKKLPSSYAAPFEIIQFHEERLLDKDLKRKKPLTVFVGSMSDIEFWDRGLTQEILDVCRNSPQHTFMFLSKNPLSYAGFNWPENTMQGLTLTCEHSKNIQHHMLLEHAGWPRPYLSIEPLLDELHWPVRFEKVIVGAMTGPKATPPKQEWIESIKKNVPERLIFWKGNIKKYL